MALPRFMRAWLVCGLGILAAGTLPSVAHAGSVLYVDDDAAPGGDGISWDSAYRFLQDALTDASGGGIMEIRTAQGTYLPDRDEANPDGTGNREATFQLVNGLALMGGYAGLGAPDPDARDIDLYESILSGDLLGNDGPNFANNDENSYHVVTGSETDETAIIDGVVISAGNADGKAEHWLGGGILNHLDSLTLTQCTFSSNSAYAGGAMFTTSRRLMVSDCTFSANAAQFGGAVRNHGGGAKFTNSTFCGNVAQEFGGGMFNIGGTTSLRFCVFSGNSAVRGGAAYNVIGSPTFSNCSFSENSADVGGAVYSFLGSPIIRECTFEANTCTGSGGAVVNVLGNAYVVQCDFTENIAGYRGGAIYSNEATLTVHNCMFQGNSSLPTGDGGGAMYIQYSDATITNCIFNGNSAGGPFGDTNRPGFGGAIFSESGLSRHPKIANCTFTANSAGKMGSGGAVLNAFGSITLSNCILWHNIPDQVFGHDPPPTTRVQYSDVQGGWTGRGGSNIEADPLFVDSEGPDGIPGTDDDDLRLQPDSPCIDAGFNNAVGQDVADLDDDGDSDEFTPFDLDGNPRFVHAPIDPHPGCGVQAIVDMGAYEFQEGTAVQPVYADLDADGAVTMVDLLILLGNWGPCEEGCCLADLDIDGSVGILDLLSLLTNWG
ncbi:MAG: hypothetical protein O7F70_08875 [Gemmatimonadetes bacterium]|nr:hypothetical protein [Gemmatimonadota bacterium]